MWCCKHVTNAGLLITPHHTSELSKWGMNQANVCLPLFLATSFKLNNIILFSSFYSSKKHFSLILEITPSMLVSFARIRCIFFLRCSFVKLSILTLLQFFTYRFCNIPKHYWRNSISQCSILRSFTSDQFKIIWKRLNSCDLSWSKTSISFTFH